MIDVSFDFTTDSPNYWDGFWNRCDGLGEGGSDPDLASPTLRTYHQRLWSKELPNKDYLNLQIGKDVKYDYLTWKDYRFASDSIIVGLRYYHYRYMIDQVYKHVGDYKSFFERLIHKSYTIGGMIIFPKHQVSMNQSKGMNRIISDRWDLTLECIRRYYAGEKSPLYETIIRDKEFFDLFNDFKGYVDFFLLQDCVSDDYSSVECWSGDFSFNKRGLPESLEEYFTFLEKEFDFLDKRNNRINQYCLDNNL